MYIKEVDIEYPVLNGFRFGEAFGKLKTIMDVMQNRNTQSSLEEVGITSRILLTVVFGLSFRNFNVLILLICNNFR